MAPASVVAGVQRSRNSASLVGRGKMGILLSTLITKIFGGRELRVLILGLDNAGKTTILFRMKTGTVVQTQPTLGMNIETLHVNNLRLQAWDLGGQQTLRNYWRLYFAGADAVIFVIDSTDTRRLQVVRQELGTMLQDPDLGRVPLLLLLNKMDMEGAMSVQQVVEHLQLPRIRDRPWHIQPTSALRGTGLTEGFLWLTSILRR